MTETIDLKTWPWWWSADEERFHGPCSSRSEAIMEAWADDARDALYLCQATKGDLYTDIFDSDRVSAWFDDANEEAGDPDGDGIAASFPDKAWDDLAKRLNRLIASFVREHGVQTWMFSDTASHETLSLAEGVLHTFDAETKMRLGELVDAIRTGSSEEFVASCLAGLKDHLTLELSS